MSYLRIKRNVDLPVLDDPAAIPQNAEQGKSNLNFFVVRQSSKNRLLKRKSTFLR